MNKITIGNKDSNLKYDFRETCFGIYEKDNQFLLVNKNNQYSFIGGGIDKDETYDECLKREFLEESGYKIKKMEPLCTIDCFWLAGDKWPLESLVNFFVVDLDLDDVSSPTEKDHIPSFLKKEEVMDLLPLPYHKKGFEIYLEKKDD